MSPTPDNSTTTPAPGSTEPVEVGRIYAPGAPWYGSFKRCRAVDCSRGEQMMPEGFCSDCYAWVQAERDAERRIVEWLRAEAVRLQEKAAASVMMRSWLLDLARAHQSSAKAIEQGEHRG